MPAPARRAAAGASSAPALAVPVLAIPVLAVLILLAACAGPAGSAQAPDAASASAAPGTTPAPPPPAASAVETAVAERAPGEIRVRLLGPRRLQPGDVFERRLGAGEHHLYRLEVPAGRLAVVAFEQLGSDVLVQPRDPAGAALVPFDSPTGGVGRERVYLLGEPGGTFDLLVRGWDSDEDGSYRVEVAPPVAAGPAQRTLVRAEHLLAESYKSRRPAPAVEAAALFASLGLEEREARAEIQVGMRLVGQGGNEAALPHLWRAAELFEAQREERLAANALTDLGLALLRLGRHDEAEPVLSRALPYYRRLEKWDNLATVLDHLGRLHANSGDSDDAFQFYEEAIAMLRLLPEDDPDRAPSLSRIERRIGAEYLALGEIRQARRHAERALALVRTGEEGQELLARHLLCRVYQDEPDLGRAVPCFQRLAHRHRERREDRAEAVVLIGLGQVLRDSGRLAPARAALQRALALFEQRQETQPVAAALISLGKLELESGRPRAAIRQLRRVLELSDYARGFPEAWFGIARAWQAIGHHAHALEAVESSLDVVDRLRLTEIGVNLQASYLARSEDPYGLAVDLLMELEAKEPGAGWSERAFEISERARGRALLDMIDTVITESPGAESEPERETGRSIERLEAWRAQEVQDGKSAGDLARLDRNLEELHLRLERLEAGRRGASAVEDLGAARPLGLAAIQRHAVDRDTLLLAYDLGAERSYLWIVSSEGLETVVLPPEAEIEALAGRAYELARQSYRRTARLAAEAALLRLSDVLVGPIAERIRGKRLLVRSEGRLLYVPWAALPLPDGRRLLDEHEVVLLPSSSVLAALRERAAQREPAPHGLAVVADPVFDERDPRIAGAAGGPIASRRNAAERFDRLPHSAGEARALLALAGGGTLLKGFEATRQAVRAGRLSRHRYVHFATHAQIYSDRPALSALVLSGVDRRGAARPALLRSREIYELDLASELVVLSACRTALGGDVWGEGLVGLPQAFFAAGAQRVAVSLWEVDDHATAELMKHFYGGMLRDGLAPAAALRDAQLALSRQPRWRAPYFWASFVLQGEPN